MELAGAGSEANRAALLQHSPTGKVPALDDHELGVTIWDSLAICEHIAECHPSAGLWPSDPSARAAVARAVVMEMHSGFSALRSAMPMNVRKRCPRTTFEPAVLRDVERVVQIWERCRAMHGSGGPFLFGAFSIADCMYAPVVMRFLTYEPPLSPVAVTYCDAVASWPALAEWLAEAHREKSRIAQYEEEEEAAVPPLRFLGDARLMQPQPEMARAEISTDACRDMVGRLKRCMTHYGGIGIAAPQVGIWQRVFVFGIDGTNPRYPAAQAIPLQVWINPEITWASEEMNWMWEGCLSVP